MAAKFLAFLLYVWGKGSSRTGIFLVFGAGMRPRFWRAYKGGAIMSKLRVLFICTGNTCRSPMAEGIFNQIKEEFPEIEAECASTGVSAVKGQRVTP